jgi:iron-sulfur cluster assembly protein
MVIEMEMRKAITLTQRAADRIHALMSQNDGALGLRLGVKNGGCAGMEYTLDIAHTAHDLDEVVEDRGARIYIEAKALLFLLGTELDYEEGKLSSGFVFNNPNQTDACGCGESVTLIPAQQS